MVAIRETKNKSAPPYCELGDLEHFKQNSRNPVNNIDFRVSISFQITYTCISSEARGLTVAKNPQKGKAANWFLWVCSAATVVEKTSGLSCQTKCVWKSSCWRVDVKKIRRTKQGTMKLTKNGNKNIQCQKQGEKSPFFLGGNKTTNIWRKKKDSKFAGTPKNAKKKGPKWWADGAGETRSSEAHSTLGEAEHVCGWVRHRPGGEDLGSGKARDTAGHRDGACLDGHREVEAGQLELVPLGGPKKQGGQPCQIRSLGLKWEGTICKHVRTARSHAHRWVVGGSAGPAPHGRG